MDVCEEVSFGGKIEHLLTGFSFPVLMVQREMKSVLNKQQIMTKILQEERMSYLILFLIICFIITLKCF